MTEQTNVRPLKDYRLEDRYRKAAGRVYLTGSQALVRLPMMQRQRDAAKGLNTAGFISGYTGSPLGGYDIALKQAQTELDAHHIVFQPGINEDLGATAVWGSQQTDLMGDARYDGVFGIWYGKGPGLDRSGDALKHGSYAGASRHGGVLVLAGDDHGAKSSTTAHQSDHAFIHFGMPFFNPANVQDYLDYGLHGIAMSRFSGCWVGIKCVTDTIESAASVDISPDRVQPVLPELSDLPAGGLHARWGVPALEAERRHYRYRLPAVRAFVRANGLNRAVLHSENGGLGIVTTGKSYLDVMQALEELGLDSVKCQALGLGVYKIAMPWPLEPAETLKFCRAYRHLLVIEEKRPVIEDQLARLLVNATDAPVLLGKRDEEGQPLVSAEGELNSVDLAGIIAARLGKLAVGSAPVARQALPVTHRPPLMRLPSFCAGCPHNRSTKLPDGSMAFGGIGCHGMATFLPERNTPTLFQMGGEGAPWIGLAPFTNRKHIFQNLGDGTYYHSGLMAMRAAVAAGVNITYKILVNDAIAMTGGQDIAGKVRVDALTRQVHAEGVRRIAVVSNDIGKYRRMSFAPGTTIHHRDDMDRLQEEIRQWPGVSVLIYDQHCATELRRRRKRGKASEPDQRIFINTRVCEGCGDCGVQSNCIAIEPVETEFGRKRRINQSACNKDFSCLDGYCPSFVIVHGGSPRRRGRAGHDEDGGFLNRAISRLPTPATAPLDQPFSLLIAGIGGSGVVTLGALLGMAAHLEGRGCSVLDVAGLAQRNGPVASHVRIALTPDDLYATRIVTADLVVGCDIVVTSSPDVLTKMSKDRTRVVVNTDVAPTSAFAGNPDLDLSAAPMAASIAERLGEGSGEFLEAGRLAYALMGNQIAANLFLLGYAVQKGWLPVTLDTLLQAIELNGVGVDMNKASLAWGRLAAADIAAVEAVALKSDDKDEAQRPLDLDRMIAKFSAELTAYQDAAYAEKYRALVRRVREAEALIPDAGDKLSRAVAKYYYKLMAYKDEYEVARLISAPAFMEALEEEFQGNFTIELSMAPPAFTGRDPRTGRYRKRRFGPLMRHALRLLARFKFLRGTAFDPFGRSHHRTLERRLIAEYEGVVARLLARLDAANFSQAVAIAGYPEQIRGYDVVKDQHLARVKARLAEQLSQYDGAARVAETQQESSKA